MKLINNFVGAFADGAILFPLLMTLSLQNGMSLFLLLLSSGVLYIITSYIFQVPMSVQPLKSIAIAGLSLGATSIEIRLAAAILGLIFVFSLLFDLESYAKKVPERFIHGVQVGLGCVLIQQGLKYILPSGYEIAIIVFVIVLLMLVLSYKFQYPILGIAASIGFFSSLFWLKKINPITVVPSFDPQNLRPLLILSLVLPQIVLTSANSVLATVNVSRKYFGETAQKVTIRRLVCFIGFGNIFSAIVGGLPFCHGSGGVTAHFKGGARTNLSNYFIGTSLLIASMFAYFFGGAELKFSPFLLSVFLMTVGFMHIMLAKNSFSSEPITKFQLIIMGFSALITGNMLWVIGIGLTCEIFRKASVNVSLGKPT